MTHSFLLPLEAISAAESDKCFDTTSSSSLMSRVRLTLLQCCTQSYTDTVTGDRVRVGMSNDCKFEEK